MRGLIISDSLMRGCPIDSVDFLKSNWGFSELDLECFPGCTTSQIIGGNGEIHSLMGKHAYDHVFLVCGANDFNNNADDCPVFKFKSIAQELKDLLHSVSQLYPKTKFTMAPIPRRNVCNESSLLQCFPHYGSASWVETTNLAMSLLYEHFKVCACHSLQVTFLISPPHNFWNQFLCPDGLHLIEAGKRKIIQFFMKKETHFSAVAEDFPPLPKPSSTFSFRPQVWVPKIVRKQKPNNNLFIHECCKNRDLSFKGPTKKAASKSVKVSVPSTKCIRVRSTKPKRPKNPNPWLISFSNSDYVCSQPMHLPQSKPNKRSSTRKLGNSPQQTEEKTLKTHKRLLNGKVPWYERPEWTLAEGPLRKSRESMKQNSRRDPSLSSQREKVNTRCLDKVDDQEVKDRHSFLSSRLSSKIAFMKNSRMPFKNVSMMAQSNGKNSKSGKRVSTNNNPKLSKNIMKKLKEFFNPLKDDFSNKSIDTDEKISLTFNQSIAFLFRFRSAYTEMATGTHERN